MTELSIPFEEILLPFTGFGEFTQHQNELPARKVPVLHHGGDKIWDSLAITEYLAERHPEIWPKDSRRPMHFLLRLHFDSKPMV